MTDNGFKLNIVSGQQKTQQDEDHILAAEKKRQRKLERNKRLSTCVVRDNECVVRDNECVVRDNEAS